MSDRWKTSREMLERARGSLAGGVSSPFRAHFPVPLYFQDGCGPRLVDVDGNEYIDYALAWGPLILGHRHPRLVDALAQAASKPHNYGAQHALEISVAEKIQQCVPCAERVAFTSSGSEAVQLALRLARAATGRNLVLKFEGHYHGWMDSVLLSYRAPVDKLGPVEAPTVALGSKGQVPNAADNVIALPWNDADAVARMFERRGSEIAAVITEPVLCNSGCLQPKSGFLQSLREITQRHSALLIFDEVITGFRMALGGAQSVFGVKPDLATFGKAVAGGLPLSVVAGRADILELMQTGGVAFGGTFNGNPISLAAADATLGELMRDNGQAIAHANAMGRRLVEGIAEAGARNALPLEIEGFGAAFALHFTQAKELTHWRDTFNDDRERLGRWIRGALERGIYLLPDGRIYVSAVHGEREVEETIAAAGNVFADIRSAQ
jgi:glutamate-1-semialdehyde 2,1-aminomutase